MSHVNISEIMLEMTFDSGHRIVGHKGKCARLHGHTYRAVIRCQGEVKDPGFVVDFGDIKDLVNLWDHRMLLWEEDPLWKAVDRLADDMLNSSKVHTEMAISCVILPFNPTAENMAYYLASSIQSTFNLHWVGVELWETPKSMARGSA